MLNSIQELRDECKRLGINYQAKQTQKQLQVKIQVNLTSKEVLFDT